jgi:hypothetical protein
MKTQAGLVTSVLLTIVLATDTAFAQEPQPVSEALQTIAATAPAQPAARPARDSLLNGTLIGAAVGFGAGFATLAIANTNATDSGPVWDGESVGYYIGAGIIGAGIGAGIGALVDALKTGPRVRPALKTPRVTVSPVHSRRRSGLFVSVRY